MFKALLLFSAQALLIQSIAGQYFSAAPFRMAGPFAGPYGIAGPFGAPYGIAAAAVPASTGGGLTVSSASIVPPNGVTVLSENAIEGPLAVAGALPFLGTVSLEGALPTAGAGAVNYGCGNGAVAIFEEEVAPAAFAAGPMAYGIAGPYAAAPFAGAYGGYLI